MKTDHIDLLVVPAFNPETRPGTHPGTPLEETMAALHDIVRAGKVRYLGASTMFAWQFAQMNHVARLNGWTQFVNMRCEYNLLYREAEREMLPFCRHQGIAVTAGNVLAKGHLSASGTLTDAHSGDVYGDALDREIRARVEAVAARSRHDDGGRRDRVGAVQGRHLLPHRRRRHGGPGDGQREGARSRTHGG